MLHSINCTVRVNAQDPTYPTYKKIDCTLHCNANDDGFYGNLIDCTFSVTNLIVTACRNWNQGIRLVVTIDDIDVSAALVGNINIQHNKNMISAFSLNLGHTDYSPRTNSHIDLDKVVVITAYINGQEKKLFTGTIDEPSAENSPAFRVVITGRDYGKLLLDKVTTVVSVQDLADSTKRSDLIKYLASLAGQTDIDLPEMSAVTIDNSFSDQSVWDMVQKEAMVELYWVKCDEEGTLKLLLDEVKSDETLYPTPDWTYEEDRIIRLGYKKGRVDINKIIVLGKTSQRKITVTSVENWSIPYSKSWADDEVLSWDEDYGDFSVKYDGNNYFTISSNGLYAIKDVSYQASGGILIISKSNYNYFPWYKMVILISRKVTGGTYDAGELSIVVNGSDVNYSTEIRYDQISASVTDPTSITKYGERDGGSITYPLLETVEQCEAIGKKIIRDSHRLIGQADFNIPFNPLVVTGQTILITDNKIGINERYYIESVHHNIDVNEGHIKARTQVGGVLYV